MHLDTYHDKHPGIRNANRNNGRLLNKREYEVHNATTYEHTPRSAVGRCLRAQYYARTKHPTSMDLSSAVCAKFGLTVSNDKPVLMHQQPQTAEYCVPLIHVNSIELKTVNNCAYLGSTLMLNTNIDDEVVRRLSKSR
ncbi:hypothetical protein SprV_0602208300 [Sparganum proliferum]